MTMFSTGKCVLLKSHFLHHTCMHEQRLIKEGMEIRSGENIEQAVGKSSSC